MSTPSRSMKCTIAAPPRSTPRSTYTQSRLVFEIDTTSPARSRRNQPHGDLRACDPAQRVQLTRCQMPNAFMRRSPCGPRRSTPRERIGGSDRHVHLRRLRTHHPEPTATTVPAAQRHCFFYFSVAVASRPRPSRRDRTRGVASASRAHRLATRSSSFKHVLQCADVERHVRVAAEDRGAALAVDGRDDLEDPGQLGRQPQARLRPSASSCTAWRAARHRQHLLLAARAGPPPAARSRSTGEVAYTASRSRATPSACAVCSPHAQVVLHRERREHLTSGHVATTSAHPVPASGPRSPHRAASPAPCADR